MSEGFTVRKDGSLAMAVGHDAVRVMQVNAIITGLDMYIKTGGKMILTRGATPTRLLKMAESYTGKKYKRTQKQDAINDLKEWRSLMMSALPVRVEGA